MSDAFATAMQLLLAESPSVDEVQRAAGLLEAASSQGHAQASERCALLDALGSARPPDWDRALDYLELAASQGSQSAQEQLLLLADNQCDPVIPQEWDGQVWADVRSRIQLDQRTRPGEKQSLSDSPRIRIIKQFATAAEC